MSASEIYCPLPSGSTFDSPIRNRVVLQATMLSGRAIKIIAKDMAMTNQRTPSVAMPVMRPINPHEIRRAVKSFFILLSPMSFVLHFLQVILQGFRAKAV